MNMVLQGQVIVLFIDMPSWRKSIYHLSDKEIVRYYGQIWGNVKHIKDYVRALRKRYIDEVLEGKY